MHPFVWHQSNIYKLWSLIRKPSKTLGPTPFRANQRYIPNIQSQCFKICTNVRGSWCSPEVQVVEIQTARKATRSLHVTLNQKNQTWIPTHPLLVLILPLPLWNSIRPLQWVALQIVNISSSTPTAQQPSPPCPLQLVLKNLEGNYATVISAQLLKELMNFPWQKKALGVLP